MIEELYFLFVSLEDCLIGYLSEFIDQVLGPVLLSYYLLGDLILGFQEGSGICKCSSDHLQFPPQYM